MIDAVECENPPLRLLLGSVAYRLVSEKLKAFSAEIEAWREVSLGADYPPDAVA
jgi:hypothetical protein